MAQVQDPITGAILEVPGPAGLADAYGRVPGLRVENLDYIWDRQNVTVGFQGTLDFFSAVAAGANRRTNNFRGNGFLSVHEAFLLHQLVFLPEYGSSGADLVEIYEKGVVELKINGKTVNQFLLKCLVPGTGFSDAGVPYPGRANPLEPIRLADVPLGAGESLEVIINFYERLLTQNIVPMTCQIGGTRWKPAM